MKSEKMIKSFKGADGRWNKDFGIEMDNGLKHKKFKKDKREKGEFSFFLSSKVNTKMRNTVESLSAAESCDYR